MQNTEKPKTVIELINFIEKNFTDREIYHPEIEEKGRLYTYSHKGEMVTFKFNNMRQLNDNLHRQRKRYTPHSPFFIELDENQPEGSVTKLLSMGVNTHTLETLQKVSLLPAQNKFASNSQNSSTPSFTQ